MSEFNKIKPGSLPPNERLEVGTRVIDPVFSAIWQIALSKPRLSLFLALQKEQAWFAQIDRNGLIWNSDTWGNGHAFPIRWISQLVWRTPEGVLIFGEESQKWLRDLLDKTKSPVYTVDFHQISRAAETMDDLIYDERRKIDQPPVEFLRTAFLKMMDDALLAAQRAGFDADDMESERLVRVTRGGRWHLFENWLRVERGERALSPSEAVPGAVVEIRLRSIIPRPAPMLPALVEVRS